jgi:cation diffusion facilitator family transporter
MPAGPSTRIAVLAALGGNLLVALTKSGAALWTGSSAMFSEAVHSFVDTGNELLLLYGMHRSHDPADREHPIGYGRELYFWSFIVALLVFAVGAGVSVVQGIAHLRSPEPIENAVVSYVVLCLSALFEGASFVVSLRQFRAAHGGQGLLEAVRRSKDPPSFMVLLEDGAALIGLALALLGTWGAAELGYLWMDGAASVLIGLLLGLVAAVLARESKSLLIGERADRRLGDSILRIVAADARVERAHGLFTVQLAPDQVVVALSVQFRRDLTAPAIEVAVQELEQRVREAHAEVVYLQVKPQSEAVWRTEDARLDPPGEALAP